MNRQKKIEIAFKKVNNSEFDKARDLFSDIIKDSPQDIDALSGLAYCYFKEAISKDALLDTKDVIEDLMLASKYCSEVLKLDEDCKIAKATLGGTFYEYACILINNHNHVQAIEYLLNAKKLLAEEDLVLERLAEAYYFNEQIDEMEKVISVLKVKNGKSYEELLEKIKITKYFKYLELLMIESDKDISKAEWYFRKAINLIPSKSEAYFNLAICYKYEKRYDEAIELLNTAILKDYYGDNKLLFEKEIHECLEEKNKIKLN